MKRRCEILYNIDVVIDVQHRLRNDAEHGSQTHRNVAKISLYHKTVSLPAEFRQDEDTKRDVYIYDNTVTWVFRTGILGTYPLSRTDTAVIPTEAPAYSFTFF